MNEQTLRTLRQIQRRCRREDEVAAIDEAIRRWWFNQTGPDEYFDPALQALVAPSLLHRVINP